MPESGGSSCAHATAADARLAQYRLPAVVGAMKRSEDVDHEDDHGGRLSKTGHHEDPLEDRCLVYPEGTHEHDENQNDREREESDVSPAARQGLGRALLSGRQPGGPHARSHNANGSYAEHREQCPMRPTHDLKYGHSTTAWQRRQFN